MCILTLSVNPIRNTIRTEWQSLLDQLVISCLNQRLKVYMTEKLSVHPWERIFPTQLLHCECQLESTVLGDEQ